MKIIYSQLLQVIKNLTYASKFGLLSEQIIFYYRSQGTDPYFQVKFFLLQLKYLISLGKERTKKGITASQMHVAKLERSSSLNKYV